MGRTTLSEPEKTPPASAQPSAAAEPPSDDPVDERDEEQASRALLSGLSNVSPPRDLAQSVPALIHRRSQGRFFGRKSLAERLPLEWISLVMLLVLAVTYAVLKLLFTD